jgi:hypothetical protein
MDVFTWIGLIVVCFLAVWVVGITCLTTAKKFGWLEKPGMEDDLWS